MATFRGFSISNLLLLLLSISLIHTTKSANNPRVKIPQGHLEGSMLSSVKGRQYFAFKGIPYAKPPTGINRFKPPLPPISWKGTLKATKYGASCPQMDFENNNTYTGEENCLFVNIYTPSDVDTSNLKPVMVYIHGGAFTYGSGNGDWYGGGRFMDYDVVLVTINYRLSVMGFLNVNEDFAPGNVGLLDQIQALKWVNENVRFFGGDQNKITLFGQSAGGASVIYHLISPLSKGLFHRAIAQSGSAFCKWAHVENPLYWATRLANDLKCPVKPLNKMVECLREKPAEMLISNTLKNYDFMVWPMPFIPSIQHVENENNFLSHSPGYVLRNGVINNVTVITGFTKDEGMALYLSLFHSGLINSDFFNDGLTKFLSTTFRINDKDQLNSMLKEVKKEYLEGVNMEDKATLRSIKIEILSDAANKACGLETAKILASRKIPTYMYSLEHKIGVAHGDDLRLLFEGPSLGTESLSSADNAVSEKILKTWIHFANYGAPDEDMEWHKVDNEDQIPCVRISNTISPGKILNSNKMKLWNNFVHEVMPLLPLSVKTEL